MAKGLPLRNGLWENLGSAILALVLSVIVWVNATYQNDPPRDDFMPEPVPIQHVNRPEGLTITNDPEDAVRVQIRAYSSIWPTLSARSFEATVDWSGLEAGEHELPVRVTTSERTVTILRVQPATVQVDLEPTRQQSMEVEPVLADLDDLPLGYSAEVIEVSPQTVSITGSESAVAQVQRAVASVSLAGQREPGERAVEVRLLDADDRVIEGVRVSPNSVVVSFDIQRQLNYREVAVRARTAGQPARGYFVSSVNVQPSTVTVVGPPAVIATMPGLVTIDGEVDVTDATRLVAERKALDLPAGVSVFTEEEGQSQQVLVTVEIDAVMGGTTLEVPLIVRKLREGLSVTLSVPSVDVIVTGPAVKLDQLQLDMLVGFVDLGGLGPGTHQVQTAVEIAPQNGDLSDVQVTSISPAYVEADIREAPTPTSSPTAPLGPTARP